MKSLLKLLPAFCLAGGFSSVNSAEYQTKFDQFLQTENLPIFTADRKDKVETNTAKSKTKYYNDQIFIAVHINFEPGSAELSEDAKHVIEERVMRLQGKYQPTGNISVEGHSDHAETIVYGKELSKQRAQAVADYILKSAKNLTEKNITVKGLGADAPILSGQSNEEKAQNRHVFIFSKGKTIPMASSK